MNALLLVSLSFFGQASLDDGSLVFLENCSYFVERYTGSPVGHVAVAVNDDDQTWLYEATPSRVRRMAWGDYQAELGRLNSDRQRKKKQLITTWVLEPATPLTNEESTRLKRYLESQLDRRYSVRGIVRGQTGDGIHCAELASHALNATGRWEIDDCHTQSPADVMKLVRPTSETAYQAEVEPPMPEETWCARAWRRWAHVAVMCRWSWGEAWHYCWQ